MIPAIEISNLNKSIGKKDILKDISLTIYRGEIVGLIGHNGAGKSTLINILTGIKKPTQGSFVIYDNTGTMNKETQKVIGVMPDVDNLYQDMTVRFFLSYMSEIKGAKLSLQNIRELLEQVGLEAKLSNTRIKALSFGMKKKLCLAQALVGEPQLLILDEPTSGLDVHSVLHIKNLLLKLRGEGKTILLSSHNMEEVEKSCDRVAILKSGELTDIGTIEALIYKRQGVRKLIIRSSPVVTSDFLNQFALNIQIISQESNSIVIQVSDDEDISLLLKTLIEHSYKVYEVRSSDLQLKDIILGE